MRPEGQLLAVIRLMRGQVVIREQANSLSRSIWTPVQGERQVSIHRGVVLGIGAPAELPNGVPIPHGFVVGDVVQYHFIHHKEAHTRPWPPDGLSATWVPQQCVDAVIYCGATFDSSDTPHNPYYESCVRPDGHDGDHRGVGVIG